MGFLGIIVAAVVVVYLAFYFSESTSPEKISNEKTVEANFNKPSNTSDAYQSDWSHFKTWCVKQGYSYLPTSSTVVLEYAREMLSENSCFGMQFKPSTVKRRLSTIKAVHLNNGYGSVIDSGLLKDARRCVRSYAQLNESDSTRKALFASEIRQMADAISDERKKDVRDKAIILIGFVTGMRRSELSNLKMRHLSFNDEGVVVQTPNVINEDNVRSFFVHYGQSYCPVTSLNCWIQEAGIEEGYVFRSVDRWGNVKDNSISGRSISRALKNVAEKAEFNRSRVSPQSLRAGHIVQRKLAGESNDSISEQTGHSPCTLHNYNREAKVYDANLTRSLEL